MLLNNQEITEEIKEKIEKYIETNDNENTTIQNLWDAAKAVLRRKLIAIQCHFKKQEKSQINNLTLHLKQLERDFPGGAVVKNLPANAGDMGSSPGPGRSHMPRNN